MGGGAGPRAHLGQEGRDEHEEDVVDEQHQQQQRAGLGTGRPEGSAQGPPPALPSTPPRPGSQTHRPSGTRPCLSQGSESPCGDEAFRRKSEHGQPDLRCPGGNVRPEARGGRLSDATLERDTAATGQLRVWAGDARLHVCLCVSRFLLLGLGLGPGSRPEPCASAPLVSSGFPSSVHLTSKEAALLRAPARLCPRPAVTDAAATPGDNSATDP